MEIVFVFRNYQMIFRVTCRLTTVGYGDVVPKGALGQITAIVCGCVGLMFIGYETLRHF